MVSEEAKTLTPMEHILQDKTVKIAFIVCGMGFVVFLLWSAFVPLAQGVVAYGHIVTEDNRKVVQHLEGGIIDSILVREGDQVETGAPLLILTDVAAQAGRDQLAQTYLSHRASVDRLTALLEGEEDWSFHDDTKAVNVNESVRADIFSRQQTLFSQQKQSYEADINVLTNRKQNFESAAEAAQGQIDSLDSELKIVKQELTVKQALLLEGLIQKNEVIRLERDEAGLEAELSRLQAEQLAARASAREVETQITQTQAHFQEKINAELVTMRQNALIEQERLTAAQDVVNRTIIYAPQAGEIFNLNFVTKGGVVRPGEDILEIVPMIKNVVATLELRPSDRDVVHNGLRVNTRLAGLNNWSTPSLDGEVINVSADLKTSPRGDYQYYEARILLHENKLEDPDVEINIIPGMPVEAFIFSGHSRTLLGYLWEPISGTIRRGLQG